MNQILAATFAVALLASTGGCAASVSPDGVAKIGFRRPATIAAREEAVGVGYTAPQPIIPNAPVFAYVATQPAGTPMQRATIMNNTTELAIAIRYGAGTWVQNDLGTTLTVTDQYGGVQTVPVIMPVTLASNQGMPVNVVFFDSAFGNKEVSVVCLDVRRGPQGLYGEVVGQAIKTIRYGSKGYSTWPYPVWNYTCSAGRR
jgi:hypothetical protein